MRPLTFLITVYPEKDWDTVKVVIDATELDDMSDKAAFSYWMAACEYMVSVVASKSAAGQDRAMELLVEGAKTYSDVGLRVIKPGGVK